MPASANGWGVGEFLLADLFHAMTGTAHPNRPSATSGPKRYAALRARLEAQRARLAPPAEAATPDP